MIQLLPRIPQASSSKFNEIQKSLQSLVLTMFVLYFIIDVSDAVLLSFYHVTTMSFSVLLTSKFQTKIISIRYSRYRKIISIIFCEFLCFSVNLNMYTSSIQAKT